MHQPQPFQPVQGDSGDAQPFEVIEDVIFNAFQPGLCCLYAVCLNAEREKLGLDEAVVPLGKLALEHFGILGPDAVKSIIF